ncbi:MAG: hypothetical protein UV19_C0008G0009 [Parcubacteria group bacterium GW2011_GWA2_42_28]|nr:MAG: hypothetical protein UV19_C0008G0009 [Parcubacteria group bacterium GW2011_GWA2_42_28]
MIIMKTYIIEKENRKVAELHISSFTSESEETLIENISGSVRDNPEIGYAGFDKKEDLIGFLKWKIFKDNSKFNNIEINHDKVRSIIESALFRCLELVKSKKLYVFVFPTFDEFVKEKLTGVSGYSFWKNTIIIHIFPGGYSDKEIGETLCHEFAHAVSLNYNEIRTLLDQIIADGIAEHFREEAVGGGKSPWAASIDRDKAKNIFNEIKNCLDSEDWNIRNEIFYGSGRYPNWSGYSIGYYIIEDFLSKHRELSWNDVIKIKSWDILLKSGF